METPDNERELVESAQRAAEQAGTDVSEAIGQVPGIVGRARSRAEQLAERFPEAFGRVQSGAQSTVTRLQTMPDSELRLLVAASLGLGAGLRIAGAPRLAMLAGFVPAAILGFAIVSRPNRPHLAPQKARP